MTPVYPPLAPQTLEQLRYVSSATISTQLFKLGLHNMFMPGLRPLAPTLRMVGEARTLRYAPAREDLATFEAISRPDYPQRAAIEGIHRGQVLVVDCRGVESAAAAGEIYMSRLKILGAAGCVIDGSIRDFPAVQKLGLPVYARSPAAPPHPAAHLAVDLDVPIGCAEVLVMPGDIIVGDGEGVVCIPRNLADQVAQNGLEMEELETFVLEKIQGGARVPGTYPPDEATKLEYEAWRKARR